MHAAWDHLNKERNDSEMRLFALAIALYRSVGAKGSDRTVEQVGESNK